MVLISLAMDPWSLVVEALVATALEAAMGPLGSGVWGVNLQSQLRNPGSRDGEQIFLCRLHFQTLRSTLRKPCTCL